MSAIVVRSRDASGLPLTPEQRKTRAELVANRTNESKTLAGLQVEKASIEGQAKVAEVDLGPVAIWRRCSAPPTRTSCAGSSLSSRCCSIPRQCSSS